jgi:monofunctional biosynthetic peptidoglycan transglycosylase
VNGDSRYVRNRSERIYRIMVSRGIVIPEFEEVMKPPEETPPETVEDLISEADTSGIEPAPGEDAQEEPAADSPQDTETPDPPDAVSPEAETETPSASGQ